MSAARRTRTTGTPAPDERAGERWTGERDAERAGAPEAARVHPVKRVVLGVVGCLLVLVGVALLVLPGPGLLLVLAGLILVSRAVPAVRRLVEPVRAQAMQAAEASVSSRWRIAGSSLVGCALVVAGVIWGTEALSWLPFPGWSTGSSLILSGAVVFALLGWSYRRVYGPRGTR